MRINIPKVFWKRPKTYNPETFEILDFALLGEFTHNYAFSENLVCMHENLPPGAAPGPGKQCCEASLKGNSCPLRQEFENHLSKIKNITFPA